jgi:pyruvate kinase
MNPLNDSRTKVVCTMGPASWGEETVREMIRAGMDVARINLAHGRHEEHAQTIGRIRAAAQEEQSNVAILADLQGPKHRIGRIAGEPLFLAPGDAVDLVISAKTGEAGEIPVPEADLITALPAESRILLGDGTVVLRVVSEDATRTSCLVTHGGRVTSHQGIRTVRRDGVAGPRSQILSEKDLSDLRFAIEQEVDFVAMSFVGGPHDVVALRDAIGDLEGDGRAPAVLAKIERDEAVRSIDGILEVADAVMVARGDLGIEIAPEHVPFAQKEIIERCRSAAIPVITATQMLLSMVDQPRPTRAEASDVANAVLDGTDAVMLSEETAIGQHPVDAVEMMGRIVRIAEERGSIAGGQGAERPPERPSTTDAVSDAAARIAEDLGVKLIAAATHRGYTARRLARARPRIPILALTPDSRTARRLALTWGVHPLHVPDYASVEEMIEVVTACLRDARLVDPGDTILLVGGLPFGAGQSNLLKVHTI